MIEDLEDARAAAIEDAAELRHAAVMLAQAAEREDMVKLWYWIGRLKVLGDSVHTEGENNDS